MSRKAKTYRQCALLLVDAAVLEALTDRTADAGCAARRLLDGAHQLRQPIVRGLGVLRQFCLRTASVESASTVCAMLSEACVWLVGTECTVCSTASG